MTTLNCKISKIVLNSPFYKIGSGKTYSMFGEDEYNINM